MLFKVTLWLFPAVDVGLHKFCLTFESQLCSSISSHKVTSRPDSSWGLARKWREYRRQDTSWQILGEASTLSALLPEPRMSLLPPSSHPSTSDRLRPPPPLLCVPKRQVVFLMVVLLTFTTIHSHRQGTQHSDRDCIMMVWSAGMFHAKEEKPAQD